jgi:hypothetical protein
VGNDDETRETPGTVVCAVAAGTAPLPFLGVYAVMFIVHGSVHPVAPPDITDSTRGELIAGIVALLLFIVAVATLLWLLNGSRRWPFAIVQLGMLATAVDFFVDVTKGGRLVSSVVAIAAVVGLVCAFLPQSWDYLGYHRPRIGRPKRPAAEPVSSPDLVPFVEEDETTRDPQSV